ncbi:nucleotidyltransferase family protein [Streptacidiphilus sp. PB12-B1b]|uniref:nucleotidyltransferase family protein n=1 Tax=Streptacidiphilus sp. PB12-B1b TaxID=2705012 RepID=UPI0015FA7512|nr:nucleotidyltransferase family protein [Streptacidiphilus sp. PB12-B1b]QMU78077.1 nucleotidyltransferase family protein [Streptacidiphilus sp. PB12-B1b]
MRAFVLAAGLGERLRPLTAAVPKPLVPVFNRPVIGHVIDALVVAGCTEIGVNVHAFPDRMALYLARYPSEAVRLTLFHEPELLGSAETLRQCREFFVDGPTLVTCADTLSTVDFAGLIRQHRRRRPTVTLAGGPVDESWRGDYVRTTDGISVRALARTPGRPTAVGPFGSFGTCIVEPGLLDTIPPGAVDLARDVLTTLPSGGRSIEVFDAGRIRLCDVNAYDQLHRANTVGIEGRLGASHRGRPVGPGVHDQGNADLAPAAAILGPVLVGANVSLGRGCELIGPLVVGHGAVIGAGAAVADAVVLPGSVVPDGADIRGAVFGDPWSVWPAMLPHLY